LALAVQLKAGLDGIKNKMKPPAAVDLNIFAMDDQERKNFGIDSLPGDLKEALGYLSQDEIIKQALGDHIYQRFMEAKMKEYDSFRLAVHPWEIERYLETY
jgi:glutamine synthetase